MWLRALPVTVLFTSWAAFSTCSLHPGDQAKVSTALDTAQYVLLELTDQAESEQTAIQDALTVNTQMQSLELLKKQNNLLKIASVIGKALKAVKAASAIASFIFTFFMPSQLEVITNLINERFREVNAKLDSLDDKLDRIEESIKDNIAFNILLASWNDMESDTRNGAKKLKDIRTAMGETDRQIKKVKLAEEYVNFYEQNNLEGNLLKMYRMAALPEDLTHRNLFDRFIDEYGCDIRKLSSLMIIIKKLILSAAQQQFTYFYFKGDQTRATNGFNEIQQYFYEIRLSYDKRIWKCRVNGIDFAKTDATKILKSMKGSAREDIGRAIFDELKMKYPWYSWAIAAADEDGTSAQGFELRGYNFFTVEDRSNIEKVKRYYIVFQDASENPICDEIKHARTFVVFKQCEGCNSDYIISSENVLSEKKCGRNILEKSFSIDNETIQSKLVCKDCTANELLDYFSGRHDLKHCNELCVHDWRQYISKYGFIAASFSANNNACQEDKCNGHGQCKAIPFASSYQCICNHFYEGETCENKITFDDSVEGLMSELRHKFRVVNGVPTTVDVFFSLRDLSKKLYAVLQKIQLSFSHTKNIVKHSDIIYHAEDVADLYGKLQKGEIRFEQFGEKIDNYLKAVTTPFELVNRLKKMILGKGILDSPGNDIYNTFKREYISIYANGCSTTYNADVQNFRDSLAYLDQAVGEALLLHQKWLIDTQGNTDDSRTKHVREATNIKDIFKGRQEEYNAYWTSYSCGYLTLNGTGFHCKNQLTYHGMELEVKCDKQRKPDYDILRCSSEGIWVTDMNEQLFASGSLDICRFVWDDYGPWGSCSTSCDGGEKYRYRNCLGTSDVNDCIRDQNGTNFQSMSCNTQPCCSEQYGKFRCSSGKCIAMEQVCDGYNNCGDGDDESRSRCPSLIRSGDMVALKNTGHQNLWLSCYCTVNCGYDRCKLRGCPGSWMDTGDWDSCAGERFLLYGIDLDDGEAILSGDRVALQYGWDASTGRGNWLSCWGRGSVCPTRTCPGFSWNSWDTDHCRGEYFWIFSPDRHQGCSSDINTNCRGEPIRKGDTVFVLYTVPGYWLSGTERDIRTRTCPGQYIEQNDKNNCHWESWMIYSRGY